MCEEMSAEKEEEERRLLIKLSELSGEYRSRGMIKKKEFRKIEKLICVYCEGAFDSFSDKFIVALYSSLLDMCTLNSADSKFSQRLGDLAGSLLVKVSRSSVVWSIHQQCGTGIASLLREMATLGCFGTIHDNTRLLIQEGCANISVPISSGLQVFALQIFYCTAYSFYASLQSKFSHCFIESYSCGESTLYVDMQKSLAELEAPLLCWQSLLKVLSMESLVDKIGISNEHLVLDGCLHFVYNILEKNRIYGDESAAVDQDTIEFMDIFCRCCLTILDRLMKRMCSFAALALLQKIIKCLQVIDLKYTPTTDSMNVPDVEMLQKLVLFLLRCFLIIAKYEMIQDRKVEIALPSNVVEVFLKSSFNSLSLHLALSCTLVLLLRNSSSNNSRCDLTRTGLEFVKWCSCSTLPQTTDQWNTFVEHPSLLKGLQQSVVSVLKTQETSNYVGNDFRMSLKIIFVTELVIHLTLVQPPAHFSQDSKFVSVCDLYIKCIEAHFNYLERLCYSLSPKNSERECGSSKRTFSVMNVDSNSDLQQLSRVILLSMNRIDWESTVHIMYDFAFRMSQLVCKYYEIFPTLFVNGHLECSRQEKSHFCISKWLSPFLPERMIDLFEDGSACLWSQLWANVLVYFTFFVVDKANPSIKMLHKTTAQIYENHSDVFFKYEVVSRVFSFFKKSLPILKYSEFSENILSHVSSASEHCLKTDEFYSTEHVNFIKHNVVDLKFGKSLVDVLFKHRRITSDKNEDLQVFYASELLALLVKYRWMTGLGVIASKVLAFRKTIKFLKLETSKISDMLYGNISRHGENAAVLALMCNNVIEWQRYHHVDCTIYAPIENDVSVDVVKLIENVWSFAKDRSDSLIKEAESEAANLDVSYFKRLNELLVQIRLWTIIEKNSSTLTGKSVAGDVPWKVAQEIDNICVAFTSLHLPLDFNCIANPLGQMWLVGLIDSVSPIDPISSVCSSTRHNFYQRENVILASWPMLLKAEETLKNAMRHLLKSHIPDRAENSLERQEELQLWIMVPTLAKLSQILCVISPETAIWALSVLCSTFHRDIDWVYHLYFENFVVLSQTETFTSLVVSYPQLCSDLVFTSLLSQPHVWDMMSHLFRGHEELERLVQWLFPNILQTIIVTGNSEAYCALKALKARTIGKKLQGINDVSSDGELSATTLDGQSNSNFCYTLEKDPASVLRIILQALQCPGSDEASIVGGDLYKRLTQCAQSLNKSMKTASFLNDVASQKVLLVMIWHLGKTESSETDNVIQALRIFCTCFLAQSWVWSFDRKTVVREASYPSSDFDNNLAEVLNRLFVYIFYKVVLSDWLKKSQRAMVQTIHVLQAMVSLLRPEDLGKFLPKFMFAIESSLSHDSPCIQLAGSRLVYDVVLKLPSRVLADNAGHVIVSLYPLMKMKVHVSESGHEIVELPETKLCMLQHMALKDLLVSAMVGPKNKLRYNRRPDFARLTEFSSSKNVPAGVDNLCNVIYSNLCGSTAWQLAQAQNVAVRTFNKIFIDMRDSMNSALTRIPLIPNIPALHEVYRSHSRQQSLLGHTEQFALVCDMLTHTSAQLRILALRRLLSLLQCHRRTLRADIYVSSTSGSGVISRDSSLHCILSALLMLASRDTDKKIRELCGICLGEIGAIDPARVRFKNKESEDTPANESKGGDFVHELFHPRCITVWTFGMLLLEHQLVPELKSDIDNVYAQDRTCFAIQTVLRILAESVDKGCVLGKNDDNCGISFSRPMPEKLRQDLSNIQLLETVEPYWSTNYHIKDLFRSITTPIYEQGLGFERWLGLWCRHLSEKVTSGPLAPLIKACRGILRTRAELSRFILPYLVIEVLVFSDSPNDAVGDIASEIRAVLSCFSNDVEAIDHTSDDFQSGNSESDLVVEKVARSGFCVENSLSSEGRLAVQSIFDLLDTLHFWSVNAKDPSTKDESNSQSKADRKKKKSLDDINVLCYDFDKSCVLVHINTLLNDVSKLQLAQAAMSVDAHSRALRYFEQYVRDLNKPGAGDPSLSTRLHLKGQDTIKYKQVILMPDVNCHLPLPSASIADYMMVCYSRLGDGDSLQGVVKLRQRVEHKPSLFSRICLLEHTGLYTDALQEYDSYRDSLRSSKSVDSLQICFAERGRVRCLKEMGQLHAVLDQVVGGLDQCQGNDIECAVLPTAVEAAWELQQWPALDSLLCRLEEATAANLERSSNVHREDGFRVSIGYVMSCLKHGDHDGFKKAARDCRLQIMGRIQGISCRDDAYSRAYPALIQLHILREVEEGFSMLHNLSVINDQDLSGNVDEWSWDERLTLLSPSLCHRDAVMACRRGIFTLCEMKPEVASSWANVSDMKRKKGDINGARVALRHAEICGLDLEQVLIKESTLVKESGNITAAIALLEPLELDVAATRLKLKRTDASASQVENSARNEMALRLFLTAKWMSLSHVKHGKAIIDRYKLALDLRKDWEAANFELAKYHEIMAEQRKEEITNSNKGIAARNSFLRSDEIFLTNTVMAIENYIKTIKHGTEHLLQALPKLLTMWFDVSSLSQAASLTSQKKDHLLKVLAHLNSRLTEAKQDIHASTWYLAMPQLVSRISHANPDTVTIIRNILIKILVAHPQQAIWHISSLINSFHDGKRNIARDMIQNSSSLIMRSGLDNDQKLASMLQRSGEFFEQLVALAELQPSDRRIAMPKGLQGQDFSAFLIPTQTALTIIYPPPSTGTSNCSYFPTDQMFISSFKKNVDVMATKAKPKKIELLTTCGRTLKFLVKQEKDGDLRKDERMMQFNGVVNRLLIEDDEGRKRQLKLRTFSVICLNEECGVLEWVGKTQGLRPLVMKAHSFWPDIYPPPNFQEIRKAFEPMQKKYSHDIPRLTHWYISEILTKVKPCFHRWFLEEYRDPSQWLAARNLFSRSCALWGAVGHIVGLGDRHGENILIDTSNGECVHVDFDCIFDKGLTLAKPEVTPFRLTPNMVDAMGVCGVEGGFRGSMEVALRLLRDHKEVLLSVLEPFIYDPTVAWNRSSSKQNARGANSRNDDSSRLMATISERLDGIYNLKHPLASEIIQHCKRRGVSVPAVGLGSQDDNLPLSAVGQTARLIDEATSANNLSQMYIGWMPWL